MQSGSDNVVITGTGQPGNPYVVTVTGLASCEEVQDCVGQATEAGSGITYDDAANSFSVLPSTDAGNSLTTGTDGNLYVSTPEPAVAPNARVTRNSTIPSTGTSLIVPFELERWDTESMWDVGTPTILTVPTGGAGLYELGGCAQLATSTTPTGARSIAIRVNGITVVQSTQEQTEDTPSTVLNASTHWRCAEGDQISMQVAVSIETDPVQLVKTDSMSPELWATWLRP